MSPAVVTTTAKILCPHGFPMTLSPATHLSIDGKGAVTAVSLNCKADPNTTTPCARLTIPDNAWTTDLSVDGKPVLLETVAAAVTDGTPPKPISVTGVQSKMTAS
jgi:hypothetical protein